MQSYALPDHNDQISYLRPFARGTDCNRAKGTDYKSAPADPGVIVCELGEVNRIRIADELGEANRIRIADELGEAKSAPAGGKSFIAGME